MSGFFKDNPPSTQVGSEDATESTIQEDALTQTDTSGGFFQGSPDQTTTDAYTADALVSKNAAEAAKVAAEAARDSAASSASDASDSEAIVTSSQNAAAASAAASAASAATSTTKASEASSSESTSTTKAAESAASAAAASTSESNAASSSTSAANSSSTANTKAVDAAASAANSLTSENNASSSATTATTQATNSAASAASSLTAKNASEAAQVAAETAESNAASSATSAASSATSASGSATTATTQAGTSTTQAGNSATSATAASNSASSAASAQTAAEAARDSALAALDSFDDRYLGSKSSAPTVDNDGNALVSGALYFDSTTNAMKVYDGSQWLNAYASLSGALLANQNLSDLNNSATARTNLGLGSAATTAASDYATAAQADQTVSLTGSGATSVSGAYPNFTITSTDTDTDTNTTYTAGSGITLTGTVFSNSAPDQTVALTGSGDTTVSGTYPNFTISSAASIDGTTINPSAVQIGGTTVIDSSRNLTNIGTLTANYGAVWSETVQGTATGTIHLDPDSNTDHAGSAITFGASDASAGANAQAGIYTRSDGNYGTKLYFSTTDSYASGSKTALSIDHAGNTSITRGALQIGGNGVWHAGNDGSGSGLDADLLDGQHASAFATLSGSNSFSNSYNEFGNSTGSVSNDGGWNARVNIAGSSHARLDVKSVSDGIITSIYSHTGQASGKVGTYSNHPLHLMVNGSAKAVLSTTGSLSTTPQGTLWGVSNDGSGSGLDADLLDGQQGSYYNQSQFTGSAFTSRNSSNPIAIDSVTTNMVGYVNSSSAAGFADGAGFSAAYSSSWVGQLFVDFRTGKLSTRGKNSGTWQAHRFMWDNLNDGSGSGLDADVLDGVQASQFLRSDVADTQTSQLTVARLKFTGEGGNSNVGNDRYALFQEAGAWSHPYPDLIIGYHTGIKIGGHQNYNGTRFYNDNPLNGTEIFSLGNGDSNTRVLYNLKVSSQTDSYSYIGNSNVAGTGNASYHPSGIYSTGSNWLYGTQYMNGYDTYFAAGSIRQVSDIVSDQNYGRGLVGVYSATRYQHVWSMGAAYRTNDAGTSAGNMYGLTFTHTNIGTGTNQAISGLSHQLQGRANGGLWWALGSGIWTTGNITAYSDISVKTNLERIPDALSKVCQINGYTYDRTDYEPDSEGIMPETRQAGVVAQEVEKVLPEVVSGEEGNKAVAYGNMVSLLIEAIKEQQGQIEDLKQEIQALKGAS